MIRRKLVTRRNRRKPDPAVMPSGTDIAVVFSIVATKLRCTCSLPYILTGVPAFTQDGLPSTAVTVVSSLVFDVTFAAATSADKEIIIPSKDPAVRSSTGGYLIPRDTVLP